ncbi:MAG: ATP-dependent Clp protease proteolytic subunit [Solirubrobacterales bacterium]
MYAHHTGQTQEQNKDDKERDKFYLPEDAVTNGLIDRVIESHEYSETGNGVAMGGV